MNRFYKIIQEKNTFKRTDLTKVGWIDESIDTIHAFKKGDDRYLKITFDTKPTDEVIKQVDKKIFSMGKLELVPETEDDKLVKLFTKCLSREEDMNYLVHFDKATYR